MTLGENLCTLGVATVADFWQSQDFDGPGAIGQPANEAALLERHDEPMNSRFRAQLQRFFHFVERRGHPSLLQALVDEANSSLCFFVNISVSKVPPRFAVEVQSGKSRFWLKQIANKP